MFFIHPCCGFNPAKKEEISLKKVPHKHPVLHFFRSLLLFAILFSAFFYWSNHSLQTTHCDIVLPSLPEGFEGTRITVLSDTHGAVFGKDNERFFSAVTKTQPELIFLLGDLEDSYRGPVPGYPEAMAAGLSAIAPTYYVTGNHEWAIGHVPELKERLRANGVHVLSNEFVPLERNGDTILLAGIDDPNGRADQKTPEQLAAELTAACGDPFWLLLAHRNNRFENQYSLLGADLVLTGHGHGGIIRLPFTDGLIDADRTLFSSYTAGVYEKNGSTMFVTRGVGNSGISRRLFNRPEIASLILHKAD